MKPILHLLEKGEKKHTQKKKKREKKEENFII
jgi:hypothetical protein